MNVYEQYGIPYSDFRIAVPYGNPSEGINVLLIKQHSKKAYFLKGTSAEGLWSKLIQDESNYVRKAENSSPIAVMPLREKSNNRGNLYEKGAGLVVYEAHKQNHSLYVTSGNRHHFLYGVSISTDRTQVYTCDCQVTTEECAHRCAGQAYLHLEALIRKAEMMPCLTCHDDTYLICGACKQPVCQNCALNDYGIFECQPGNHAVRAWGVCEHCQPLAYQLYKERVLNFKHVARPISEI